MPASEHQHHDSPSATTKEVTPRRPFVAPTLIREEPLDALTANNWEITVMANGGSP